MVPHDYIHVMYFCQGYHKRDSVSSLHPLRCSTIFNFISFGNVHLDHLGFFTVKVLFVPLWRDFQTKSHSTSNLPPVILASTDSSWLDGYRVIAKWFSSSSCFNPLVGYCGEKIYYHFFNAKIVPSLLTCLLCPFEMSSFQFFELFLIF